MISMSTYIKAHVFGSTEAAVRLAKTSPKHREFAEKLIGLKNSAAGARKEDAMDRLSKACEKLRSFGLTVRSRDTEEYCKEGRLLVDGTERLDLKGLSEKAWVNSVIRIANKVEMLKTEYLAAEISQYKYNDLARLLDNAEPLQASSVALVKPLPVANMRSAHSSLSLDSLASSASDDSSTWE